MLVRGRGAIEHLLADPGRRRHDLSARGPPPRARHATTGRLSRASTPHFFERAPGRPARDGASPHDPPVRRWRLRRLPEEGWPSMDRVAGSAAGVALTRLIGDRRGRTPAAVRCFASGAMRWSSGNLAYSELDRGLNRLVDYPRHRQARRCARTTSYHIVDHSYAQLVHGRFRRTRTVVTCHDLDAFRSILDGRPRTPIGAVPRDDAPHPRGAAAGVGDRRATLRHRRRADASGARRAGARVRRAPRRRRTVREHSGCRWRRQPRTSASVPRARAGGAARRQHRPAQAASTCSCTRSPPSRRIKPSAQLVHAAEPLTDEQTALAGKLGDCRSHHRAADARRSAPGRGLPAGHGVWRSRPIARDSACRSWRRLIGDGRRRQRPEGPARNRRHRRAVLPARRCVGVGRCRRRCS